MKYIFEFSGMGPIRCETWDSEGHRILEAPEVLSTRDACRLLKRSRRHLYRYIQRGWLQPITKFSGELFFDARDIRALQGKPRPRQVTLPKRMAPLFPEYEIQALHATRDADLILARILERGDRSEVHWALRHYLLRRRRAFLQTQGSRLLSDRTRRFWCWLWDVPTRVSGPSWRKIGRTLGGAP